MGVSLQAPCWWFSHRGHSFSTCCHRSCSANTLSPCFCESDGENSPSFPRSVVWSSFHYFLPYAHTFVKSPWFEQAIWQRNCAKRPCMMWRRCLVADTQCSSSIQGQQILCVLKNPYYEAIPSLPWNWDSIFPCWETINQIVDFQQLLLAPTQVNFSFLNSWHIVESLVAPTYCTGSRDPRTLFLAFVCFSWKCLLVPLFQVLQTPLACSTALPLHRRLGCAPPTGSQCTVCIPCHCPSSLIFTILLHH